MSAHPLSIAIDGPASSGKGTVARLVAQKLGLPYVDTGAMYRSVGLCALRAGLSTRDEARVGALAASLSFEFGWDGSILQVRVNGEDVTSAIRTEEVGRAASDVAVLPGVRIALLDLQRGLARSGAVMDGRDIGTVVLPDADLKIYLDASAEVRAQRRRDELATRGDVRTLESVLHDIVARDAQDSGREHAPLRAADDAIRIDSTRRTPNEVVDRVLELAAGIVEASAIRA
jgi:cytidylate kinase